MTATEDGESGMTLAAWLQFLHAAYKSLQQANTFSKDMLLKTILINT